MKDALVSVTLSQPRRLAFCLLRLSSERLSLTSSQHSLSSQDLQVQECRLCGCTTSSGLVIILACSSFLRAQVSFCPVVTEGGSPHYRTVHGGPN